MHSSLSLGGGYGWLTGSHGMVIDNIIQVRFIVFIPKPITHFLQATVVTADGSILVVNSSSHPDLYWGIHGGGCNFGCVTEFVYRLHPQRSHVFSGPLVFPPSLLPAVVNTVQEWHTTAGEKEGIMMGMTNKGPTGTPAVVVFVFYNGEEEEGRKKFAKLIALGPIVNAAAMIPYETVNAQQNGLVPYGANYRFTCAVRGGKPVEADAVQEMFAQVIDISNLPGGCADNSPPTIVVIWEFFNLKKAASVPADATAFRMRVEHALTPILISWEGESSEASQDANERSARLKLVVEEALKGTFDGWTGENDTGYGNYGEHSRNCSW
jgi:hypothetical protein